MRCNKTCDMNLFPRKVEFMALFLCLFSMTLLPQTCYSFESKTLIKNQVYEAEFLFSGPHDIDGDILVTVTDLEKPLTKADWTLKKTAIKQGADT